MKNHKQALPRTSKAFQTFKQGVNFCNTAHLIRGNTRSPQDELETAAPMMVLDSFAIELMLKSLIIMNGQTPPKTHRLNKLFQKIPHKQQRAINDQWEAQARPQIRRFTEERGLPSDLSNALAKCANAYDQLRYVHEGKDPVYYLQRLPNILMEVVGELQPDWVVWEAPPA